MSGIMNRFILPAALAALLLVMAGCGQDKQEQQAAETEQAKPPAVTTVKGKVLEAVEAGSFLYVLLDRGEKQTWAAVPLVDVEIGEEVTLRNANFFNNFYSKALQRSYDELIFSSGIEGKEPKRREASIDSQGNPVSRRSRMLPAAPTASKVQDNTAADPSSAKAK